MMNLSLGFYEHWGTWIGRSGSTHFVTLEKVYLDSQRKHPDFGALKLNTRKGLIKAVC